MARFELVDPDLRGWLLVTDLDGTLWDREGLLQPGAREAVETLSGMGATVLAATARRPAAARRTMVANDLLLPAVLFDGALGRDFAADETFHVRAFERDAAVRVLAALRACGLEPCVNVVHPERDVLLGEHPSTNPRHVEYLAGWSRHADLGAAVETEEVLSFTLVGRETRVLLPALAAAREIADATLSDDITYGGSMLSVRPRGISKWTGILSFCAARGLDPARTLAVGDGENDVEMLAAAAVSCTFEGSSPGPLARAGHVLPPAADGGWPALAALAMRAAAGD